MAKILKLCPSPLFHSGHVSKPVSIPLNPPPWGTGGPVKEMGRTQKGGRTCMGECTNNGGTHSWVMDTYKATDFVSVYAPLMMAQMGRGGQLEKA